VTSVRCTAVAVPYVCRMSDTARFELRLPAERRRELDALARETGLSAADIVRLSIKQMLERRDVLASGRERSEERVG
jgi:predicted DNA-binding protein